MSISKGHTEQKKWFKISVHWPIVFNFNKSLVYDCFLEDPLYKELTFATKNLKIMKDILSDAATRKRYFIKYTTLSKKYQLVYLPKLKRENKNKTQIKYQTWGESHVIKFLNPLDFRLDVIGSVVSINLNKKDHTLSPIRLEYEHIVSHSFQGPMEIRNICILNYKANRCKGSMSLFQLDEATIKKIETTIITPKMFLRDCEKLNRKEFFKKYYFNVVKKQVTNNVVDFVFNETHQWSII